MQISQSWSFWEYQILLCGQEDNIKADKLQLTGMLKPFHILWSRSQDLSAAEKCDFYQIDKPLLLLGKKCEKGRHKGLPSRKRCFAVRQYQILFLDFCFVFILVSHEIVCGAFPEKISRKTPKTLMLSWWMGSWILISSQEVRFHSLLKLLEKSRVSNFCKSKLAESPHKIWYY